VHAGEVDGPQSVWAAIRDLGASRIGHGIHSLEDAELVEFLVDERIGLEIAITSNVQIGVVEDYGVHPVRRILEAGIVANLNTDDPAISGNDLRHEFEVAAPRAGLSPNQTRQAQANALEMAFLSPDEKRALMNPQGGPPAPSRSSV
jgi:adenosine deaminase